MIRIFAGWALLSLSIAAGAHSAPPDAAQARLRAQTQDIVQNFVRRQAFPELRKVDRRLTQLCRKRPWPIPDVKYRTRARFTAFVDGDWLYLATHIRFSPKTDGGPQRASKMLQDTQACAAPIRAFFRRYQVDFDLVIDSPDAPRVPVSDREVELSDSEGRSDTDKLNYLPEGHAYCLSSCASAGAQSCASYCEKIRQNKLCLRLAHEVGHYLGLHDTYVDPQCPDRPYRMEAGPPFGLMESMGDWDSVEWLPEEAEGVLGQLLNP